MGGKFYSQTFVKRDALISDVLWFFEFLGILLYKWEWCKDASDFSK